MTPTAIITAIAAAAIAANPATPSDSLERQFSLNEVVVTGTRTPKTLKDTPVPTRLITADDIKRADATNIADLLQQELPGVEFSYAMNQQTNINLGGFSGQNVLVLLDGERLAGETMDNTDFSRLLTSGAARIEIIRGAASALYGSNASGGVVNIITRTPSKPWSATAGVKTGSHHTWRADINTGLKIANFTNSLDINFNRHSTYQVCHDPTDQCDFRSVAGQKVWSVADRITYSPSPRLKLAGRASYYFKQRLYNPATPDRYRAFASGMRAQWQPSPSTHAQISYSFDQYDKSDFIRQHNLDIRDYRNAQNSLRALISHNLTTSSIITLGADLMRDYLDSYQFAQGQIHTQTTADAFAQIDHSFPNHWEIIGAARWDYFSDQAHNHLTAKLNARYRLNSLTIRSGYASGFRAPTLKEKYTLFNMADIFDIHGNPNLQPETSHNFQITAEYTWQNLYFTLGGSYNLVDNRITTSSVHYTPMREPYIDYINVDKLRVGGIDAQIKARWANGLQASLAYNFTHEQTYGQSAQQYCPARPHSLNARLSWTKQWHRDYATDITLSGRFLSAITYQSIYLFEPFAPRTITNPAYTMWKLHILQHIASHIDLTFTIDNLLNYRPSTYYFNSPITTGTTLLTGLTIEL